MKLIISITKYPTYAVNAYATTLILHGLDTTSKISSCRSVTSRDCLFCNTRLINCMLIQS